MNRVDAEKAGGSTDLEALRAIAPILQARARALVLANGERVIFCVRIPVEQLSGAAAHAGCLPDVVAHTLSVERHKIRPRPGAHTHLQSPVREELKHAPDAGNGSEVSVCFIAR